MTAGKLQALRYAQDNKFDGPLFSCPVIDAHATIAAYKQANVKLQPAFIEN